MKDWFLCRNCRKTRIDEGVGFETPMICERCYGSSWVYITGRKPPIDVRNVIVHVIAQRIRKLRKGQV